MKEKNTFSDRFKNKKSAPEDENKSEKTPDISPDIHEIVVPAYDNKSEPDAGKKDAQCLSARAIGEAHGLHVIIGDKCICEKKPPEHGDAKKCLRNLSAMDILAKTEQIRHEKELIKKMHFDKDDRHFGVINTQTARRPVSRVSEALSIAVVDDNPSTLLAIEQTLRPRGYSVRTFDNAFNALIALKDEPCNVLVTSCKLRQMNGVTLARMAKTPGDAAHVLLLTDRYDGSVFNLIKSGHIDGFLIRPLSKKELLDKIDSIIDS